MSTSFLKSAFIIVVATALFFSLSSCRTHSGGRACPSYSHVDMTKKQG